MDADGEASGEVDNGAAGDDAACEGTAGDDAPAGMDGIAKSREPSRPAARGSEEGRHACVVFSTETVNAQLPREAVSVGPT